MAFTQGDDLNILQQTDASVVSAGAGNDTYVLAPDSLAVGQSVTLNDARGTNTLKLTGGLEIVSSKVASNTLQLTLSNEAVVTLNGAAGYRFDVGGTALSDGVAKNFAGFARDVLGVTVPQSGLAEGGAISVNDTLPTNPDVDLPARVIYETEPNDQLSHANSAAFGDTLKGTSYEDGDRDVFKLEATEGGRVTLDFTHPNGPGDEGAEITLALADAAGNVISERTFSGNDTLNATVPNAGTYHVVVKDQAGYRADGINGAIEAGLYAVKTRFEGLANTAFDASQNDTFSRAVSTLADSETALAFGHSMAGTLNQDGDEDVYRVSADQGGAIVIEVTHPNGIGGDGADMQVELLNLQGKLIAARDFSGDLTLNASVATAGDYYLRLSDKAGYRADGANGQAVEDGFYHVRTQIETDASRAYDTANNATYATAVATLADGTTKLAFGHDVVGTLGQNGDEDMYRVSANEGGAIVVDVVHPNGPSGGGAEMQIELLNIQGELIAERDFRGDMTLNASVAEAGDYYIRVTDRANYRGDGDNGKAVEDGFYQLNTRINTEADRAYDTASNATLATAVNTLADGTTPLDFTHGLQGTVAYSGDIDVFYFNAGATAQVTANFIHPNGPGTQGARMSFEVLDAQGGVLLENDSLRGHEDGLAFNTIQGNDYYVRLKDDGNYRGDGTAGQTIEDNFYQVDFLIA